MAMIQCNPLAINARKSFAWLYFEYLSLQILGM